RAFIGVLVLGLFMSACQKELSQDKISSEDLENVEYGEFATLNTTSILTPETPFTVMSFNLRNDPRSGSGVPPDPFNQAQRMTKLTTILSTYSVDILGVQELSNNDNENYVNN